MTKVDQYIQDNQEESNYNDYYSFIIDIDYKSLKQLVFSFNPVTQDQYYSVHYYKNNLQCVSNYSDFDSACKFFKGKY